MELLKKSRIPAAKVPLTEAKKRKLAAAEEDMVMERLVNQTVLDETDEKWLDEI